MTQVRYKIGLAGCGRMGSAMVRAWLDAGILSTIDILDPNGIPDELLHTKGVAYFKSETDFAAYAATWDILILAIKPQTLDVFCDNVGALPHQLPLLSIMAGKTIAGLEVKIGNSHPIVRSMPNTPASIGKGMTAAYANAHISLSHKSMVQQLLETLGKFAWLQKEDQLDAVTGVSGSGPAYVFYLIETMTQAGIAAGLSPDIAATLARETVIGAAALAEIEAETPAAKLRENVTSPNGTTAAALEILMDGQFQDIVSKAIARAAARSRELSQ